MGPVTDRLRAVTRSVLGGASQRLGKAPSQRPHLQVGGAPRRLLGHQQHPVRALHASQLHCDAGACTWDRCRMKMATNPHPVESRGSKQVVVAVMATTVPRAAIDRSQVCVVAA